MQKINAYLNKNILFKNSIYLIISNGFLSVGGFVFWIFVARIYSTYQIGIATSLIAIVSLLSSLAIPGFNTAIMRFLPTSEDKNGLINSTISVVTVTSLILSIIVGLKIGFFSPPLDFVSHNIYFLMFFVIFTISASLNALLEGILIAFRSAKYVLIKNAIQSAIKLVLPFLFITIGGYGIFTSYYAGGILALIIGALLLYRKHNVIYKILIHAGEVKKIAFLSMGSYVSGIMSTVTQYAIPILITNTLGPEETAFYYIVVTTTNVLNLIPGVIAQNLMVEGSYDIENIQIHLKKAIQITFLILIPFVIGMFFFGNYVLLVFGKQYSSEGLTLLKLLSLCSLFIGFSSILSTLIVIFNQIKLLIIANSIYAVILFAASYYFIHLGIVGLGYAAILSQGILILFYLFTLKRIKKLHLLR